ncbi:sensor histidine kinase [Cellulomonas iranensis]|uniref:Sensor-like histidine kinase SenX3 n=1 Tax=Cellulomonas iranensis TaxID=76862 RepID=A0ABU0GIM3_9CELL|nr:PAS domain-containing sensor histidine kinase [Cellulomonas iranensis]MDQ0425173.1 signal transduction histidine kinase [Cellulomonas iranensis]
MARPGGRASTRPDPGGPRPADADLVGRVTAPWLTPDAVGLRQVPTTVALLLAVALVESSVDPAHPALLVAATVLVVAAQGVAALVPWGRVAPPWRAVAPLAQLAAVALLDLGTGLPRADFDVLVLLPVGALALRPERWGPALGLAGSAVVLLAPAVVDVGRVRPLLHAVVTFLVIAATAVGAHGIVQAARRQAEELRRARDALDERARQLRASRDTLRSIVQAATAQAIVATDRDGVVLTASPGTERALGLAPAELVGHPVTGVVTQDGPGLRLLDGAGTTPQMPLARVVGRAADGGTHADEWRRVGPDGAVRHVEVVVTPRPALEGASPELPAGYLLVGTDVTPRHDEQRRQDEFIGLVSHELRTPLASILGYVRLIRTSGRPLDDEDRRYLDVVERNAHRLDALVDELLTSAQLAVGAVLSPQEVDVAEVVRASVTSQAPVARAAGVQVDVDADPAVPLLSDPQRLGQVVDNLLSNAVKHSLAGDHVRVAVRAGATPEGARTAHVRVADDGPGIAPDELARITQRFYRTRDTRRRRVRGVGLGLSLVQAIVDEHGGTLSIDSTPGAGTRVDVVLPDVPPGAQAADAT